MALKPEASIGVALATGAVVYAVFTNATPTIADVRSLEKGNVDIQRAERAATWTSAGLVAGISLLTKDPTIFVIGGAITIVMAWMTRHADTVDTVTKQAANMPKTVLADIGNTPSGVTQAPPQTRQTLQLATSVI